VDAYMQGWPELYIYTVYDRIFGDFPAAENTVYTSYIYGSGQPYIHACIGAAGCPGFTVSTRSCLLRMCVCVRERERERERE
jgi:hypothetical protein